jgi:hypothetical protein
VTLLVDFGSNFLQAIHGENACGEIPDAMDTVLGKRECAEL